MTQFSDDSWVLSRVGRWHRSFIFDRRVSVLTELLAQQIPPGATVLDIGCGDGTIGRKLMQSRSDITVEGVEISFRLGCSIPCRLFDGKKLPYPDQSFDVCLFVDVLHHTIDLELLFREGVRVSRSLILLKDHVSENSIDHLTLRFMDWVGNRPHKVPLPYNYQSRASWNYFFTAVQVIPKTWEAHVPMYHFPMNSIFGRKLHFIALLEKST